MRIRGLLVLSLLVAGGVAGVSAAADPPADLATGVLETAAEALDAPIEIDEGQRWEKEFPLPQPTPDQAPVLLLRARMPNGGGGCNFMMRVLIDGLPLRDNWLEPRLLNKPPHFTPPGAARPFAWFRAISGSQTNSWLVMFNRNPQGNWAGTGQDHDYLFDLSGLVAGTPVRLGVEHTLPGLAATLKRDRAPLLVESIKLGLLPRAKVQQLRQQMQQTLRVTQGTVEPAVPAGETGQQAYELAWSRRPPPAMQVTFDELNDWTLHGVMESKASLAASVAQRLWRPRVARLAIAKSEKPVFLALRPKSPIRIQEPFDGVNFWVYGHKHFMQPDAVTIHVQALLADSSGSDIVVDLGPIRMGYWMLLHGYAPAEAARPRKYPVTLKALLLQADKAPADYTLYLEGLHFYQRNRRPQVFGRPESPSFPQNERGMLPTPPAGLTATSEKIPSGARFTAVRPGGTLIYEVSAGQGCLGGITARWKDGKPFSPCAAGGPVGADGTPLGGTLAAGRMVADRLETQWRTAAGQPFQVDYSLQGTSLVVDLRAAGGWAAGTAFGEVRGLDAPKTIEVPYLKIARDPGMSLIACGSGVFVSVLPDFYHSDYSSVDAHAGPPVEGSLRLFNRTRYTPLSDGRRNDLRDRLLITVSPEFADTLPNHQNPRSPNLERLAPYMFVMDRAFSLNRWETFKRYGLDHLVACDFAGIFVKDTSEGFGVRWRPHPSYTIAQVAEARQRIKGLGFLFGAYADFTDFYPLNEFWDENLMALTAEGDLREAWPGSYAPKNSVAWTLARKVGQKMREHYPPDCVYLDVSTNRGGEAVDYEAGVPGAGMARSTVIGVGDSIVEARRWYGATVSEGIFRWMYAGLTDIDYAQVKMAAPLPLPLDFDLLKLHPFQIGTMMGYGPTNFLSAEEVKQLGTSREQPAPKAFYKHVATSLAYGHMAMLGYGYFPPMARSIHYYALMQGLQKEYLPDEAARIEYHDGQALVGTSQALRDGSYRRGRVRVTYRRGLVVTVNLNPEEPWEVTQAGRPYLLPPYGWVASRGQGEAPAVLAYSAIVEGQRLDYVQCPEYVYLTSGDRRRRVGPVEVTGAAWLKRDGGQWQVIPCGKLGYWSAAQQQEKIPADRGCPVLIVDPAALGIRRAAVSALAEMGGPAAAGVARTADGRLQLEAHKDVRMFCLRSDDAPPH